MVVFTLTERYGLFQGWKLDKEKAILVIVDAPSRLLAEGSYRYRIHISCHEASSFASHFVVISGVKARWL